MCSASGQYTISYNGEVYNFQDVRSELKALGVRFKSESDTEVLLEAFAEWGEGVLDRLVGQYAFAIWDNADQRLFIARDRLGEKPLYYARTQTSFAFSSEIQALRAVPGIDLAIDSTAVALYLEQSYIPAPHTIHLGIRKLPAAHAMWVTADSLRTRRYWDPLSFVTKPPRAISSAQALEELEELLTRSVKLQMVSDVPLGAFLSGGIDSTSIVSVMTALSSTPVQTFTIGFDVAKYSEADHAAAVAYHLGTNHVCEYLTMDDAMKLVPSLPATYGEPFGDASALPTQLVSRIARKSVTVSLSGDGGDELFGGYTRYDNLEKLTAVSRWLGPVPALVAPAFRHLPGKIGRLAGHVMAGKERDPYRPLSSSFNSLEVRELTGLPNVLYAEYERAWSATAALPPRRRAMTADLLSYLPEDILVKVDRAAMSTSLEVRAPFLDHRLVEWSLGLPPELVVNKPVLKEFAYKRVPKRLLNRPKAGFAIPAGEWLTSGLRGLMDDALQTDQLERVGITGMAFVNKLIADEEAGNRDNGLRLWNLVMLSLWGAEAL